MLITAWNHGPKQFERRVARLATTETRFSNNIKSLCDNLKGLFIEQNFARGSIWILSVHQTRIRHIRHTVTNKIELSQFYKILLKGLSAFCVLKMCLMCVHTWKCTHLEKQAQGFSVPHHKLKFEKDSFLRLAAVHLLWCAKNMSMNPGGSAAVSHEFVEQKLVSLTQFEL